MGQTKKNGLRVIAYLGIDRPNGTTDYGEELVKKIIRSRHILSGLIIHPSDNLADVARQYRIPYIGIPKELMQPVSMIKEALKSNEIFKDYFPVWIEQIRSFGGDLGLTVWGNWIPKELFTVPPKGFINYHPAPLPYLRGMEPDTVSILEGRKEIFGTVHQVNHSFDCGDTIARTRTIPIRNNDTPLVVLERLYAEGISSILYAIDMIERGVKNPVPQNGSEGSNATLQMVREYSFIDPVSDTVEFINRKMYAFCGQDIGIRLKIEHAGKVFDVIEVEGYKGRFRGSPGDLLGRYNGKGAFRHHPIIRVKDGVIVVRLGKVINPLPYASLYYPECPQQKQIKCGVRHKEADLRVVRSSIG
jgi:methionyl-tRNA formyltransferase